MQQPSKILVAREPQKREEQFPVLDKPRTLYLIVATRVASSETLTAFLQSVSRQHGVRARTDSQACEGEKGEGGVHVWHVPHKRHLGQKCWCETRKRQLFWNFLTPLPGRRRNVTRGNVSAHLLADHQGFRKLLFPTEKLGSK